MSTIKSGLLSLRNVTSGIQGKVFNRPAKHTNDHSSAVNDAVSAVSEIEAHQNNQRPDWYQATHSTES